MGTQLFLFESEVPMGKTFNRLVTSASMQRGRRELNSPAATKDSMMLEVISYLLEIRSFYAASEFSETENPTEDTINLLNAGEEFNEKAKQYLTKVPLRGGRRG